jgi:hypothetical protein
MGANEQVDRRRVRLGLIVVTVLFVVTAVLVAVVDDPVGRAMMGVVLFTTVVRAAILVRSLRRTPPS